MSESSVHDVDRLFCRHQHSGSVHGFSETRSRSNVWKEHTHTEGHKWLKCDKNSLSFANFGFIRFVWPSLDESNDIRDLKWRTKRLWSFRPPRWILPISALFTRVVQYYVAQWRGTGIHWASGRNTLHTSAAESVWGAVARHKHSRGVNPVGT